MDISLSTSWSNTLQTISAGLNDWGSLHPFIVHFPIALLVIAPILIIAGLISKNSSKAFYISALTLLLIGTLCIYLAVSSGEAASDVVQPKPEFIKTLEAHYHLAEQMRLHFSILTGLFLVYVLLQPALTVIFSPKIHQTALILFLVIYAVNLVLLLNTAHLGGKLVHHHGITSKLFTNVYHSK